MYLRMRTLGGNADSKGVATCLCVFCGFCVRRKRLSGGCKGVSDLPFVSLVYFV